MDKIINHGIPHIAEKIFQYVGIDSLIDYQLPLVSTSWKILAGKVLFERPHYSMNYACEKGKSDIIRLLLENSEDEYTQNDLKFYLGTGCLFGHEEVVNLLLEQLKSDVIDDWIGANKLFTIACEYGHKDVVKILLEHPKCQNIDLKLQRLSRTGFMLACSNGNKDVVRLFFEHSDDKKIDLSTRDKYGQIFIMSDLEEIFTKFGKTFE